jgi:hypothetical protein
MKKQKTMGSSNHQSEIAKKIKALKSDWPRFKGAKRIQLAPRIEEIKKLGCPIRRLGRAIGEDESALRYWLNKFRKGQRSEPHARQPEPSRRPNPAMLSEPTVISKTETKPEAAQVASAEPSPAVNELKTTAPVKPEPTAVSKTETKPEAAEVASAETSPAVKELKTMAAAVKREPTAVSKTETKPEAAKFASAETSPAVKELKTMEAPVKDVQRSDAEPRVTLKSELPTETKPVKDRSSAEERINAERERRNRPRRSYQEVQEAAHRQLEEFGRTNRMDAQDLRSAGSRRAMGKK